MKNEFKEMETEAQRNARRFQKECIELIIDDLNSDLEDDGYEFEDWHIRDHINHYVENQCIYSYDCKKIIEDLDYDIWADDPMYGERAPSEMHAAIWALEGALYDTDIEGIIKNELNISSNGNDD